MSETGANAKPSPVPTPKVTASTAAVAALGFIVALVEWYGVDVPREVEVPAETLVVFAVGYRASREWKPRKRGRHE